MTTDQLAIAIFMVLIVAMCVNAGAMFTRDRNVRLAAKLVVVSIGLTIIALALFVRMIEDA